MNTFHFSGNLTTQVDTPCENADLIYPTSSVNFLKIKKIFALFVIAIGILTISVRGQKLTGPKLVGTWIGGEDFEEFGYHKSAELDYMLKDNPDGKIVVRLCSKEKMSVALVDSNGFAFQFFGMNPFNLPLDKSYFARYSRCRLRSEQYWFIPGNSSIDYEERVVVDKVDARRWLDHYYPRQTSKVEDKEFSEHLKEFIKYLEDNPVAEGFIISNIHTRNRKLNWAVREMKNAKLYSRIRILKKHLYESFYPEFRSVTIKK